MKNPSLKIANYLLLADTIFIGATGLILSYRLPPRGQSRGLLLLGYARHDWVDLHFLLALAFIALCLLHLYLNWGWILKVAARGNLAVMASSISILIIIAAVPFVLPIEKSEKGKMFEQSQYSENPHRDRLRRNMATEIVD